MNIHDRMRIPDSARDRAATQLRDYYAEGRLSTEELDERVTAALSAKTAGDLRRLMSDLPAPAAAARGPWSAPPAPGAGARGPGAPAVRGLAVGPAAADSGLGRAASPGAARTADPGP